MHICDYQCGFVPDDGQNDVQDGSVENYPLDWDTVDTTAEPDPAAVPACPCACPDSGTGAAPADP